MLVSLKEILDIAEEKKIAVGSFNTPDLTSLQAVIAAAEELNLPVIIQFAQCHEVDNKYNVLEDIGPIMVDFAKRASVPVCAHLDHGEDMEYLERALKIGFTGIMYDGSVLTYEENLENTKKAVAMAASYGASVEAELGSMGKRENGDGDGSEDDTKIYTDAVQAGAFVKETGIAALACSFGTTHGLYISKPQLDFSVVENVRKETDGIPVVMHGGSGVSEEDFGKSIAAGVRKVNYFTYMDKAAGEVLTAYVEEVKAAGTPVFFAEPARRARQAMKENVIGAMKVFAGMN